MTTVVRPPTALTRRKEIKIDVRIPEQIFLELMNPLESGCVTGFKWKNEAKTSLEPTRDRPTFLEYKYVINKPELIDKLWRLEVREAPSKKRGKDGELIASRRGHGCARLHLSAAAEARGERTDLVAQVVGNMTVMLKVPKNERAMPSLCVKVKIATMDANGHIIWPATFEAATKAALRKQMRYHIKAMIDSPEFPTLTQMTLCLTATSESLREYPLALTNA